MKHFLARVDWMLLLPALILTIIGLVTLFSLSMSLFRSQLIALVLAIIVFLFISQVRIEVLKLFARPIYLFSLVAFFIVLGIGIESRGAVRWVSLFGATLQFSEILKPFLAVSMVTFLSSHTDRSAKSFFRFFLLLAPVLLLIYLQPDLGNAIIYAVVALIVTIVYGYPWQWFAGGMVPILVVFPLFWSHLHEYQRQRLLTFIHPSKDVLGSSYNVIQAVIAVGSGMFWGKGLSEGTQSGLKFLPERHTDFMFATISEKFGFVGSVLILVVFLLLMYRMLQIYRQSNDVYAKLFTSTALVLLSIHMFFNIGMNIGIVPVVGITLPFISFGGSSLLANFTILGMLSAISMTTRSHEVLEIS